MTKGSNTRPTRRVLEAPRHDRPFVVELLSEVIILRPKGARRGGPAEVVVLPGAVYVRAMMQQTRSRRTRRAS
jgi:hypothetical protein